MGVSTYLVRGNILLTNNTSSVIDSVVVLHRQKQLKPILMKRLILILTISFSLFTLTSSASDFEVTKPVLESFNSTFKNATEISWTYVDNIYKVNFILNDQYAAAYYDQNGKMIALTRNISSKNLPFALQVSLKKEYSSYWITNLFEFTNEMGTYYMVTLENGDARVVLKSSLESSWDLYRKSAK